MIDRGDSPARRSRATVELLSRAEIFRDYARAFQDVTGLALALRPLDAADLPLPEMPPTRVAEWCDSAVPVLVGRRPIAFLRIDGILVRLAERQVFSRLARRLFKRGVRVYLRPVGGTGLRPRVLSVAQFELMLRLTTAFARHLGALCRRLAAREARAESPQIARARAYIDEHQAENLSLSDVARAVHMSAFYFCKMFKQTTGLNFTDYLARLRVEKVKNLLKNPRRRVSEAAFTAGFQSLSQFNRVFRKVAGEAPSAFRSRRGRTLRSA